MAHLNIVVIFPNVVSWGSCLGDIHQGRRPQWYNGRHRPPKSTRHNWMPSRKSRGTRIWKFRVSVKNFCKVGQFQWKRHDKSEKGIGQMSKRKKAKKANGRFKFWTKVKEEWDGVLPEDNWIAWPLYWLFVTFVCNRCFLFTKIILCHKQFTIVSSVVNFHNSKLNTTASVFSFQSLVITAHLNL